MVDMHDGLYEAFRSKDSRFDGRFYVGVSSTGIYCRPVCHARMPKEENCTFYTTAAEAEQAGYRPCLVCRPELAPGRSLVDASTSLAKRAARLLEDDCASGQSLGILAARLGCTDRHLRRVFNSEYHISPVQYVQTCRLLLAKSLLADTQLPIVDIAMTAGFGSLRRFNDLFKKHYRMPPSLLRKQLAQSDSRQDEITLRLGYRPPYLWDKMMSFLEGRAIPGVEVVRDAVYYRTIRHVASDGRERYGWVQVGHNHKIHALSVSLSESLLPVLPQVLARVRRVFDMYCEPDTIFDSLKSMNNIRPGLCVLGTRLPGSYNSFEIAVRAILGQQITVKAASTLAGRLVQECGVPVATGIDGLTHVFPSPGEVLASGAGLREKLGMLGIISTRAQAIESLAQALQSGELSLDINLDPVGERNKLVAIKGIGSWTANYIAMRALEWPDSFLETDVGVKKALAPATIKEITAMAESWRPWRSYAVINLWNSLTATK